MGEEDDTVDGGGAVRLTCGVQRAVAASEADGCASVGDALGRLVGCVRARRCKVGAVGLAGPRSRAAWATRPSSSFSFFCFSFHLFCLNSNLVLEFEFQIGAPNLLELLSIS